MLGATNDMIGRALGRHRISGIGWARIVLPFLAGGFMGFSVWAAAATDHYSTWLSLPKVLPTEEFTRIKATAEWWGANGGILGRSLGFAAGLLAIGWAALMAPLVITHGYRRVLRPVMTVDYRRVLRTGMVGGIRSCWALKDGSAKYWRGLVREAKHKREQAGQ